MCNVHFTKMTIDLFEDKMMLFPIEQSKVHIFWEGHKNVTKSLKKNLKLRSSNKKKFGDFVIFLWPSQNIVHIANIKNICTWMQASLVTFLGRDYYFFRYFLIQMSFSLICTKLLIEILFMHFEILNFVSRQPKRPYMYYNDT